MLWLFVGVDVFDGGSLLFVFGRCVCVLLLFCFVRC